MTYFKEVWISLDADNHFVSGSDHAEDFQQNRLILCNLII